MLNTKRYVAVSTPGKAILLITILEILGSPVREKETHSAMCPATVIAAIRWMHKDGAGASLEWLVILMSPPGKTVVLGDADVVVKSLMKNQEKCKENTGWWLAF